MAFGIRQQSARDGHALARSLGISIDASKELPDLILVDLGTPRGVLVIFFEVVSTDGTITEIRRQALAKMAREAGFDLENVAFLTVFADRSAPAYRKAVSSLAWNSFAWFASEPDRLIILRNGEPKPIYELRN
jgi:hypothetical protein